MLCQPFAHAAQPVAGQDVLHLAADPVVAGVDHDPPVLALDPDPQVAGAGMAAIGFPQVMPARIRRPSGGSDSGTP